ncbi:hypothetical protein J3R82DRAFT_10383 [Butyriboletus roseoflavus]|nr:hypothetical protein J3R82DRAFT_10383 [Butyriboletus roseoflavus]
MSMLLASAVALFAILGAFYVHLSPALFAGGVGRVIDTVGNRNCKTVPQLQACESRVQFPPLDYYSSHAYVNAELVLHQPTGLIYLACSTPHSRIHWTPALDRLNASGRSELDYVATYDPHTDAINRLELSGLPSLGGISLHGMDVVPSLDDPSVLYVYLVNHRIPESADPRKVGADSVIEVFRTHIDNTTLEHVRTFQDPTVVVTPNDVVGSPDGESVHFTNDHKHKTGFGCKFAYTGLHASNGIVKGTNPGNDTFYVADCVLGGVTVLERQSDNTLAFMEVIKTGLSSTRHFDYTFDLFPCADRGLDNLAIDANGALWAAGRLTVLYTISPNNNNKRLQRTI